MLKLFTSNKLKSFLLISSITLIIIIFYNNVPSKLTEQDKVSIEQFIGDLDIDLKLIQEDYEYQIEILKKINKKVLTSIEPSSSGIPLGESREPSEQIDKGFGQCFDRSRLIEKTCKFLGFKTRHLYIINNDSDKSLIKNLLSPSTLSHATSEVKTLKGWIIIDSNFEWLSISIDGNPIPYSKLNEADLLNKIPNEVFPFYLDDTFVIYGFYSRHGNFYKPYNPIPDYNLRELLYNF